MKQINLDLDKVKKIIYELDEEGIVLTYAKEKVDIDGEVFNQTKWVLNEKGENHNLTDFIFLNVEDGFSDVKFISQKYGDNKRDIFDDKEYTSKIKHIMKYCDVMDKRSHSVKEPDENKTFDEIIKTVDDKWYVDYMEKKKNRNEEVKTNERFEDKVARKYKNYKCKKK